MVEFACNPNTWEIETRKLSYSGWAPLHYRALKTRTKESINQTTQNQTEKGAVDQLPTRLSSERGYAFEAGLQSTEWQLGGLEEVL